MTDRSDRIPVRTERRVPSLTPLFPIGHLLATPGALQALESIGIDPLSLITRHVSGDWGDLCEEDRQSNEMALLHGARIFSVYKHGHPDGSGQELTLWVITEADRACTTLLLPSEY